MSDLEDCASYLHKLARSPNVNARQQIVACIDGYLMQFPAKVAEARAELAAAFRTASPDDAEITRYILDKLDGR
jgi:hypothetical protein